MKTDREKFNSQLMKKPLNLSGNSRKKPKRLTHIPSPTENEQIKRRKY